MNRLEVGEVVVGSVKGIKPYGAFIDIGGVSGLCIFLRSVMNILRLLTTF